VNGMKIFLNVGSIPSQRLTQPSIRQVSLVKWAVGQMGALFIHSFWRLI